jgi:hypothetical protein
MKAALAPLGDVYDGDYGGDYDTTNISVYPKGRESGDCISVVGFRPEKSLSEAERDDADDVECIELRNNESDSGGGLQSDDEEICVLYGRIMALVRKMGFYTIPHHDQLF